MEFAASLVMRSVAMPFLPYRINTVLLAMKVQRVQLYGVSFSLAMAT